jgi:hypothetical protein
LDSHPVLSILLDRQRCQDIFYQLWRREEKELSEHWQDILIPYTTPRRPSIFIPSGRRNMPEIADGES